MQWFADVHSILSEERRKLIDAQQKDADRKARRKGG
jgi:hypothetical protein